MRLLKKARYFFLADDDEDVLMSDYVWFVGFIMLGTMFLSVAIALLLT